MKKLLMTALIAALLILPLGSVALADDLEASQPETQTAEFTHGEVPAETGAADAMNPAVHAVLLSMLNHNAARFDTADTLLTWESLYNMLSLYGQMDDRSEYQGELLVLPAETVMDYAAVLFPGFDAAAPLPEGLADRMVYDAGSGCYLITCGDDSLSQPQFNSIETADGRLYIDGSLVYLVDHSTLAQFQVVLSPRDNMFGYTIDSLELL